MFTYIILITILMGLMISAAFLTKKDFLSPSFLSCAFFMCSAILGVIGLGTWNNIDSLSFKLIFIIFIGLVAFILGEFLQRKIIEKKLKKDEEIKDEYIKVGKIKYVLTMLFIILTTILLILGIKKVCNYYEFNGSLSSMLNFYRMQTSLYSDGPIVDINFIVKQMQKVCEVICIYYIFILINNFFIKKEKKDIWLLAPVFLCMAQSLLTTGRVVLMRFFIFAIYIFIFYYIKYNKDNSKLWLKILKIATIGIACATSVFYLMIPLLGREKNTEPIEYVSFYMGTTIPSFEFTLNNPTEKNEYWGRETFDGAYKSIDKFKILELPKDKGYIWIDFLGYRSNVYTSLRAYYNDFGIIGVIICQMVFGLVFSWLYQKSKSNKLILIWYANYVYILIEQIRAEQFFNLISINCLIYTILIIAFYAFFNTDSEKLINTLKERKEKNV